MNSETQKEATTKARPQKISKATATPEPVDLNTLHRDIEDRSHAIYKQRKPLLNSEWVNVRVKGGREPGAANP